MEAKATRAPEVTCAVCTRTVFLSIARSEHWVKDWDAAGDVWRCPKCSGKAVRTATATSNGYSRDRQNNFISPDRKWRWSPSQNQWVARSRQERCWYGEVRRFLYGSVWSIYTLFLFCGGVYAATNPMLGGGITFLALLVAAVTGTYAWAIWTWRAPFLWFVFIY